MVTVEWIYRWIEWQSILDNSRQGFWQSIKRSSSRTLSACIFLLAYTVWANHKYYTNSWWVGSAPIQEYAGAILLCLWEVSFSPRGVPLMFIMYLTPQSAHCDLLLEWIRMASNAVESWRYRTWSKIQSLSTVDAVNILRKRLQEFDKVGKIL